MARRRHRTRRTSSRRARRARWRSARGYLQSEPCSSCGESEELLEPRGEHRISGNAQLAGEVELHAGLRIGEHALEVVVFDLDRALSGRARTGSTRRRISCQIDHPFATTITGDAERVDGTDLLGLRWILR